MADSLRQSENCNKVTSSDVMNFSDAFSIPTVFELFLLSIPGAQNIPRGGLCQDFMCCVCCEFRVAGCELRIGKERYWA